MDIQRILFDAVVIGVCIIILVKIDTVMNILVKMGLVEPLGKEQI